MNPPQVHPLPRSARNSPRAGTPERPLEEIPALPPSLYASEPEKEESPRRKERLVAALVVAYYARVHSFVRRRASAEAADDITQEVFFRVLNLRNLEKMTLEVGYFLRIAENLLKRRAGQNARFLEVLSRSGRVGLRPTEPRNRDTRASDNWWTEAAADESPVGLALDAEALEVALSLLPPHLGSAVRLIVCDGLSYEAAANALGVPASTVNNWKHRGLQRLRQIIEASYGFAHHPPAQHALRLSGNAAGISGAPSVLGGGGGIESARPWEFDRAPRSRARESRYAG